MNAHRLITQTRSRGSFSAKPDWSVQTPVVLIVFNRPDTTRLVLEALRHVRPDRLMVIADGPRSGCLDDVESCRKTRALFERIDWTCQLQTCFSETNLGLRTRVSTGLNWVFEQVERAIILEDDCVPDPTFFRFCDELLEYYAEDHRVMHIAGANFQFGRRRTHASYYFSRFMLCWGWATWRRAWQKFDNTVATWPQVREQKWLQNLFPNRRAANYWRKIMDGVYNGHINSWAYPWMYCCWLENALNIIPNQNLVSNIGFGPKGTHTKTDEIRSNIPAARIGFPLRHPTVMLHDVTSDRFTQSRIYNPWRPIRMYRKWKKRTLHQVASVLAQTRAGADG